MEVQMRIASSYFDNFRQHTKLGYSHKLLLVDTLLDLLGREHQTSHKRQLRNELVHQKDNRSNQGKSNQELGPKTHPHT